MNGIEPQAAAEWLYSTLSGDSALRAALGVGPGVDFVYESVAPERPSPPAKFVVFQQQAATDVMVVGAYRIFTNLLFVVRAVTNASGFGALAAAAARIDALLHRSTGGTTADGQTWGCVREQPFRLAEVSNGVQYRHAGGVYRLFTTS